MINYCYRLPFTNKYACYFLSHYRTDRIYFQLHDIGHITGMDIRRDNAGFSPNWKLDKVDGSLI